MAYWLSQYPFFAEYGLAGYGSIVPNTTFDNVTYYGGFSGNFILPVLSPSNTTESLASVVDSVLAKINATWPGYFQFQTSSETHPSFYEWWLSSNGPDFGGVDIMVGSRLLDEGALTANLTAVKVALQGFIPEADSFAANSASVDFISGKGVWNAVPRGGSNAVNPAWRKALIHMSKYTFQSCFSCKLFDQELNMDFLNFEADLIYSKWRILELWRPRWQSS